MTNCSCNTTDQYNRIKQTIDFFSQILSIEQISEYGFTFIRNILSLENAALYILKEDNVFRLVNRTDQGNYAKEHPYSKQVKKLATLFGRSLFRDFDEYFQEDFLTETEFEFIVPFIVNDQVVGFLAAGAISQSDAEIVTPEFIEIVKNLINLAVYMALKHDKECDLRRDIDRKMYNLFFINQSTKILFSELNFENLYQLCIDMTRELTSSSVTSFALYDEHRDKLVLRGYSDIINFQRFYLEIKIKDRSPKIARNVFHMDNDKELLSEIFEDMKDLEKLSAEYVILLRKDEIIGFVTVGRPINDTCYDKEVLNQVESLSASIYISITNALYIERIKNQKTRIEKQLLAIEKLARIVKNINSCQNIEEMMDIASDTLKYVFGVKRGCILLREDDMSYRVKSVVGEDDFIPLTLGANDPLLEVDSFYYDLSGYNGSNLIEGLGGAADISDPTCLVISPIKLDLLELNGNGVMGYIVVWDSESQFQTEDLVSVETLSNSMAPLVKQYLDHTQKLKIMSFDEKKLFMDRLDELETDRVAYDMNYVVYYKLIDCQLFKVPDLKEYDELEYYYFNCIVLLPVYVGEEVDEALFDGCVTGTQFDIINQLENIHKNFRISIC